MNAEIETLNRFEEAGLNPGRSKAMVVGIDDLLVKSMAFIDHRFNALEHAMRLQMLGMIGVMAAILLGFAGLIYAMSG